MHNDGVKYSPPPPVYWIIEIVCDVLVVFYGGWREARV